MQRGLEYETLAREIHGATSRMIGDIGQPSGEGNRNRFMDNYLRVLPASVEGMEKNLALVWTTVHTDSLTVFKLPEFVLMYRRYNRAGILPDRPDELFSAVSGLGDYHFRSNGVTREDLQLTRERFTQLGEGMGGAPTLWLLTGILDAVMQGEGIKDYHKWFRQQVPDPDDPIDFHKKRAVFLGFMLYSTSKAYIDSASFDMVLDYLREDFEQSLVGIPYVDYAAFDSFTKDQKSGRKP